MSDQENRETSKGRTPQAHEGDDTEGQQVRKPQLETTTPKACGSQAQAASPVGNTTGEMSAR